MPEHPNTKFSDQPVYVMHNCRLVGSISRHSYESLVLENKIEPIANSFLVNDWTSHVYDGDGKEVRVYRKGDIVHTFDPLDSVPMSNSPNSPQNFSPCDHSTFLGNNPAGESI